MMAIMFTFTTYGTWLRGDARGWVSKGIIYPPDPILHQRDKNRLKQKMFQFEQSQYDRVGNLIGDVIINKHKLNLYALTIQS